MAQRENKLRRGKSWLPWLVLSLSLTGLAVLQSWPVARRADRAIPYGYHVVAGYEQVPAMPGDHLQFLYWCWLMADNILGPSAWKTNPYEFNTFLTPRGLPGFANFPFSLLYPLLLPLGQAGAYNALVLISYLGAGLMAFALARQVLGPGPWTWLPALVFALLPFRAAQVLSGHLFGFVCFLVPGLLWCLERALARRSLVWGGGAGLCILLMGMMEPHLTYYSALMLGLYLPLRLILPGEDALPREGTWRPAAQAALAGVAAGVLAQVWLLRSRDAAWHLAPFLQAVLLYAVVALVLWLLLAAVVAAFTRLAPEQARRAAARVFTPLWGLAGVALLKAGGVPHLPRLLALGLAAWGLVRLGLALRGRWRRPSWPRGWWRPLPGLALGLGLAAARMLAVKASDIDQSIAAGGRSLDEVRLFAPRLADLLNPGNTRMEELIHLGWVPAALGLAGLGMLCLARPRGARGAALAGLWLAMSVLGMLLSLGPNLPELPLYPWLYHHLPFFNLPRVPGRLIVFAVLFLSLVGAWVLRELLARRPRLSPALAAVLVVAALALDLGLPQRPGVCLLPPPGRVEAAIRANIPTGPQARERLLGLPIWPGDSHQSSRYELLISRTRALVVNGYSPVVPRAYVEQVFKPLYPLDLGYLGPEQASLLRRLRVRLVCFYDDDLLYARKVSPFPPALARQRLLASGAFTPLAQEGTAFLLRLRGQAQADPHPGAVVSPVVSLWEAEHLYRNTGVLVEDPEASGWGLMFREAGRIGGPLGPRYARARGNLARAVPGRDRKGFLSFGPYRAYPPGRYRARFRLRRGGQAPGSPGWIEVCTDRGRRSLARRELSPGVLPADGRWHDVALTFTLEAPTDLELRTWFNRSSTLELDVVLVEFEGGRPADGFYRAQDLWRQTGDLVADARVPGGLAVRARAGYHPCLYLMHGPQVTVEPGRWRARFRLAREGSAPAGAPAVWLAAATDLGRRPFAWRLVRAGELGPDYRDLELVFSVPRRCELGLRVKFAGGASLRLAGVKLQKMK